MNLIIYNFISLFLLGFLLNLESFAEEFKRKFDNDIKWNKIPNSEIKTKNDPIKWEIFSDQLFKENDFLEFNKTENQNESLINSKKQKKSQFSDYLYPLQINPSLLINNFLDKGEFSNSFKIKSAFSGGAAGGTGNQNYAYKIDYGINKDTYLSAYISEADDPYYYQIKNTGSLPTKNYWRNYALTITKKFNNLNTKKSKISLNSSIELWDLATIYKKNENVLGFYSGKEIIGTISTPFTYELNDSSNITISPRFSFLPKKIGSNSLEENFFNNNFSLGIGIDKKLSKEIYFLGSYSFELGPGYTTFDDNLNFSRNNIYSYGFQWAPSPRINLSASISNSFGETPSTSHLTIPSGNIPLYSILLRLNSGYEDKYQEPFDSRDKSLLYGGHTINTALVPERGRSQVWLNTDSEGNYFGFYGYSFSDLFQVEVVNLGSFKNSYFANDQFESLKNTYMNTGNLNNRFGGKLNLLSPLRGGPFWLSKRITLGRDQKSGQGYMFNEFLSTFEINSSLAININPKLAWSEMKTVSGIGIGFNYELSDKINIIPEYNYNFIDNSSNNSSLIFRYIPYESKSFDLYISNAEGTQDLGQMLKSRDFRYGFKINFIF